MGTNFSMESFLKQQSSIFIRLLHSTSSITILFFINCQISLRPNIIRGTSYLDAKHSGFYPRYPENLNQKFAYALSYTC